jgi:O-antigen/teichoic acid export membrane protein
MAAGADPWAAESAWGPLARHTGLNLLGQVLPAVAALFSIPILLHGLGPARFGVLSVCLALLTYLAIFDFGLGRATIRGLASAFRPGHRGALAEILWSSLAIQLALGIFGGLLLVAATPLLTRQLLHASPGLAGEAAASFRCLAIGVPAVICLVTAKGVLEAGQRFDIVNVVRVPANSLLFAGPALAVRVWHADLPGVTLTVAMVMIATTLAYLACALVTWPELRSIRAVDRGQLVSLLSFGGWVTVASLLVPVLLYADRFIIPALSSVVILAYYTVPSEISNRLQVFPSALSTAIFPALSRMADDREAMLGNLQRSMKYLMLGMGPAVLVLLGTAHPMLYLWVGADVANRSAPLLMLLVPGVWADAVSQMPAQLLDAVGRPDLRAKTYAVYVPIYLAVTVALIAALGLTGAALAWTGRAMLQVGILLLVSARALGVSPGAVAGRLVMPTVVCVAAAGAAFAVGGSAAPAATKASLTALVVLAFVVVAWRLLFAPSERAGILSAVRLSRVSRAPGSA